MSRKKILLRRIRTITRLFWAFFQKIYWAGCKTNSCTLWPKLHWVINLISISEKSIPNVTYWGKSGIAACKCNLCFMCKWNYQMKHKNLSILTIHGKVFFQYMVRFITTYKWGSTWLSLWWVSSCILHMTVRNIWT